MASTPHVYFAIYKPYGYLSQFTKEVPGQLTLADLYDFPPDVYPVGRLDQKSEGLLILTNDSTVNSKLLDPANKKEKTYWAQVEGAPNAQDLLPISKGMELRIKKRTFRTAPGHARVLERAPAVEPRDPAIRYRKDIPDSWIEIKITEGKYHQVRKMCAAIGFPVLRLIRVHVGKYQLPDFNIGKVREISQSDII